MLSYKHTMLIAELIDYIAFQLPYRKKAIWKDTEAAAEQFGLPAVKIESNLRKIFAYSGLYYIGVTILALFPINDNNLVSAFIYLLVYIVAFCGIYTIFYGYRSRGDYFIELDDIKGVSTQRPFLSVALLIFMISLIYSLLWRVSCVALLGLQTFFCFHLLNLLSL